MKHTMRARLGRRLAQHRPLARRWAVVAAVSALGLAGLGPAFAVHDEGFSLAADIDGETVDWVDLFDVSGSPTVTTPKAALPDDFVAAAFAKDFVLPDSNGYATGSKDTLPISLDGAGDWQCRTPNNLGSKFDLVNAYAGALVPTSGDDDGDLIIYFGSEVSAPEGNRNMGVWLLQDPTVDCSGDGNTDFSGSHVYGDVFIVSAFTNGGTTANIDVYEWVDKTPSTPNDDPDENGQLQLKSGFTNASCPPAGTTDDACAIANTDGDNETEALFDITPPWDAPDKDGDGVINEAQFMEGAVNLTDIGLDGCYATFLANTRSSQSPGSTIHDFARDDFNTCGSLKIRKFVDYDGDGQRDLDDPTTPNVDESDTAGDWAFTVKDSDNKTVTCSETSTGADGELVCASLDPGTYTITETQVGGYYNTKAGSTQAVDKNGTVSTTATVGLGEDVVVDFGNICYVDKKFQITGVPENATKPSSITVQYAVNDSGNVDGPFQTVALTETATEGVWEASVNDTFLQTDTIDWRWYINGASGHTAPGANDEPLQSADPTHPNTAPRDAGCQLTNSKGYPKVTVSGTKYKDMDADGQRDLDDPNTTPVDEGEPGLAGFTFSLKLGDDVMAMAVSDANGNYSFSDVPAGSYTVVETAKTGWLQTEPSSGGRSVVVNLDSASPVAVGAFGNTPLSDIDVTFTPLTSPASTKSTISCTGPTQPTGAGPLQGSQTDGSLSGDKLIIGTYQCTIVISDP